MSFTIYYCIIIRLKNIYFASKRFLVNRQESFCFKRAFVVPYLSGFTFASNVSLKYLQKSFILKIYSVTQLMTIIYLVKSTEIISMFPKLVSLQNVEKLHRTSYTCVIKHHLRHKSTIHKIVGGRVEHFYMTVCRICEVLDGFVEISRETRGD